MLFEGRINEELVQEMSDPEVCRERLIGTDVDLFIALSAIYQVFDEDVGLTDPGAVRVRLNLSENDLATWGSAFESALSRFPESLINEPGVDIDDVEIHLLCRTGLGAILTYQGKLDVAIPHLTPVTREMGLHNLGESIISQDLYDRWRGDGRLRGWITSIAMQVLYRAIATDGNAELQAMMIINAADPAILPGYDERRLETIARTWMDDLAGTSFRDELEFAWRWTAFFKLCEFAWWQFEDVPTENLPATPEGDYPEAAPSLWAWLLGEGLGTAATSADQYSKRDSASFPDPVESLTSEINSVDNRGELETLVETIFAIRAGQRYSQRERYLRLWKSIAESGRDKNIIYRLWSPSDETNKVSDTDVYFPSSIDEASPKHPEYWAFRYGLALGLDRMPRSSTPNDGVTATESGLYLRVMRIEEHISGLPTLAQIEKLVRTGRTEAVHEVLAERYPDVWNYLTGDVHIALVGVWILAEDGDFSGALPQLDTAVLTILKYYFERPINDSQATKSNRGFANLPLKRTVDRWGLHQWGFAFDSAAGQTHQLPEINAAGKVLSKAARKAQASLSGRGDNLHKLQDLRNPAAHKRRVDPPVLRDNFKQSWTMLFGAPDQGALLSHFIKIGEVFNR
jgi:hypothetical protein